MIWRMLLNNKHILNGLLMDLTGRYYLIKIILKFINTLECLIIKINMPAESICLLFLESSSIIKED